MNQYLSFTLLLVLISCKFSGNHQNRFHQSIAGEPLLTTAQVADSLTAFYKRQQLTLDSLTVEQEGMNFIARCWMPEYQVDSTSDISREIQEKLELYSYFRKELILDSRAQITSERNIDTNWFYYVTQCNGPFDVDQDTEDVYAAMNTFNEGPVYLLDYPYGEITDSVCTHNTLLKAFGFYRSEDAEVQSEYVKVMYHNKACWARYSFTTFAHEDTGPDNLPYTVTFYHRDLIETDRNGKELKEKE